MISRFTVVGESGGGIDLWTFCSTFLKALESPLDFFSPEAWLSSMVLVAKSSRQSAKRDEQKSIASEDSWKKRDEACVHLA
jgi:hypothetical protein